MAKALNPNSGRQTILKVLYDDGGNMTPAAISAALKAAGHDIKYLHSHLNYFKTHAQIYHLEDKSYQLSDKMRTRLDEMYGVKKVRGTAPLNLADFYELDELAVV
jgi:hypothetical protein